jgi:hypothetical protein
MTNSNNKTRNLAPIVATSFFALDKSVGKKDTAESGKQLQKK